MEHKGVNLIKDLSRETAIEAYKWFLHLSGKGKVTSVAKNSSDRSLNNWKLVRNTIRQDPNALRLWKPIATFYLAKCEWCLYFINSKCRKRTCKYNSGGIRDKYKYSLNRVSGLFGISKKELLFIHSSLTEQDTKKFEDWLQEKVSIFILPNVEKTYYNKIYNRIYSSLNSKGHFKSKFNKAWGVVQNLGADGEGIVSEMYKKIAEIIRRYDYLPEDVLVRACSRSLNNEFKNILSAENAYFRKTNLRNTNSETDNEPEVIKDAIVDEDTIIQAMTKRSILESIESTTGILREAMDVMLGDKNAGFIEFLKEKGVLKTRASWASFYSGVEPISLRTFVNEFFNLTMEKDIYENVKRSKQKKKGGIKVVKIASRSEQKPLKGGTTMAKLQVIIPKKKCVVCGYWAIFLGKKRRPKDCNPSFPGCPVHSFQIEHQFNIRSAAVQLKQFQINGDNKEIKEFFDRTPSKYISEIMSLAQELTVEDVDIEVEDTEESDKKEIDLDSLDKAGLLAMVIEEGLQDEIPNSTRLDEEELREALFELFNNQNSNSDDDEDEDTAVIGDITAMGADDEDEDE